MSAEATNHIISINRKTFEDVYNRYWEKVYAVCYNNIRDVEIAKEMVQDIFRSLWERRAELELDNVERYLVRSAKYKAFEFIRNKTSRQKIDEFNYQGCINSSNCTEEQVFFNNLKENVDLLVDTLPCQCKKVYKMSREDGLSNKEISEMLMISERAVEYHITRAMTTLKMKLAVFNKK
ncbi:RNA polymerase sigma-70 factor [Pedobacter sp. MC2016-05]|uniref:RNA polymerase sigma-70 factor n=1 Tax=Pedobacter sp. MC2016-05 TaxID=2994474 RepID=UPI002245B696|nr:RNA polymerase sigma-70 factor [Pedobacter sp. MC2016-05]MCX2476966.1 RNA polymerase sigma-70 factor [Pedobacter sp. MC2016-05]